MPETQNMVVVHFRDGRILKGYTYDFNPISETFHVIHAPDDIKVGEVSTSLVKAVFFVKTFEGHNEDHSSSNEFSEDSLKGAAGLKVKNRPMGMHLTERGSLSSRSIRRATTKGFSSFRHRRFQSKHGSEKSARQN